MTEREIKLAKINWAILKLRIADEVRSGTPTRVPWPSTDLIIKDDLFTYVFMATPR